MSKRASGPPRRPRNPIAKAVRAPLFRQRLELDKRRLVPVPKQQAVDAEAEAGAKTDEDAQGET
jgi:hypothetical protein